MGELSSTTNALGVIPKWCFHEIAQLVERGVQVVPGLVCSSPPLMTLVIS